MPDLSKYAFTDSWTDSEFIVPGSVMPKRGEIPQGQFTAEARDPGFWSYLKEHYHMTLSASPDQVRWWQDRGSAGNQSLYRILATHFGKAVPSNFVLLGLCALFGLLLMLATRIRGDSVFVLGVLFYTAFVLIGPQSSKAHFIAFFGLLLYSWHDALEKIPGSKVQFCLCSRYFWASRPRLTHCRQGGYRGILWVFPPLGCGCIATVCF